MKGCVRTWEKSCRWCGSKFTVLKDEGDEKGIKCSSCNYRPESYYIFLYWNGKKHRIGKDTDGNVFDSYRRASRQLEAMRKNIDDGIFTISHYLPKEIEQYRGRVLLPKWLDTKTETAPTTYREYKRYVETYFLPAFGTLDFKKLTAGNIEDFLLSLPEHLSPKTKKNILVAFRNFCSWIHRREVISKIPVFPVLNVPEPTIQIISRSAQESVLGHLRRHPIFSFMVYHPVRPGEARALKRKHFDTESMTVLIESAFSLKEIRSRKNRKAYALPISAKFDLSCLKDKLPEAFVFTNQCGRPYRSENIRRIWHRACKKAGVPAIRMYNGLRHSTATHLLKQSGGNLNLVSKATGHSSIKMTEKYARHDVELLREIIDDGSGVVRFQETAKHN